MAFWAWSRTAASNGNSDSTINFLEGQAPSTLNDSNRSGMARLREYADDITGAIVTGGTSTAYTVTSYQVFDTLAHLDKQTVAFTPHATNGATVTLNVDGLGAKPLRYGTSLELQSGTLIAGTPYVALYNNSDAVFYLRGITGNPCGVPLGGVLPYTASTAPNSAFVLCGGQTISRTTYATYFSLVGTTYGVGDGSTTFTILDLRGRAIFGLDNPLGSAAGRISVAGGNFSPVIGATGGFENHTILTAEMPSHSHANTATQAAHSHSLNVSPAGGANAVGQGNANTGGTGVTDSQTPVITMTNASTGGGGAMTIMPPAIVLPYILRVI